MPSPLEELTARLEYIQTPLPYTRVRLIPSEGKPVLDTFDHVDPSLETFTRMALLLVRRLIAIHCGSPCASVP